MELQWPLIIFTALTAWASGLFATQCMCALKGDARKSQIPSLIASVAILGVGGIAVFFHLEHWERIFNGFGNPTSGITHELVMIVILVAVMVAFFALARQRDGVIPKPLSIAGIAVSALLVIAMAHSYMMASRPVWNTVLWVVYVLGNACVLGPATFALIDSLVDKESDGSKHATLVLAGAAVNAVTTLAYAVAIVLSGSSFVDMGYSIDPTLPAQAAPDMAAATNVFAGEYALLTWAGVILIGAVVPVVCAYLGKKKAQWKIAAPLILVAALIGAFCMRVLFYLLGNDVFLLF